MRRTAALAGPVLALTAALLLAGCGGQEEPASPPSAVTGGSAGTTGPAGATTAPTGQEPVAITITVTAGSVEPAPRRYEVPLGGRVRLTVTGDVQDSVHVHGYDQEADLVPGRPTVLEFTADVPGLFEVETHHPQRLLAQLVVE